ncbi:hypothetical protein CPT_Piffle_056 [Stenotrophomonas phage Piffle]|uniref:Uncharacterized protein n=1 Tax=Stenotrophomonas phage Piffle TaxID=2859656 RepID=A0AAE7WMP8_9CAUD|nr:hypothetical protein PP762_gp76 [Stenotrophomonas phage Piffle]QYW01910.1 hypothetical protein CPT_Piffle_056 [Stenotrophomonas phage Piffle]
MAKKGTPQDAAFNEITPVIEALKQPQLRKKSAEIKELNRLNGEITHSTNNMGFVFMGVAYADADHAAIAGKNYTQSGVPWPQLHLSLWDRANEMIRISAQGDSQLTQVRQYLGLVLAASELDKYAKRNCIPDYLVAFMPSYKDVPRSEPLKDAIAKVPRINLFYKKVEESMAVLAASQLIY